MNDAPEPDQATSAPVEPAPAQIEPTPEQIELRARGAAKAIRRSLAAVLCLEAFCVLLVPRAIAQTSDGLGTTKTVILIALAVVLVFVGAMVRYPWGIGVGSIFQLTMIAVGFWTYAFFVVAALFIGIWIYLLKLRHELVGTPGGLHLLF